MLTNRIKILNLKNRKKRKIKPPKFRRASTSADLDLPDLIALWLSLGRIDPSVKGCLLWRGAVNNTGLPILTVAKKQYTAHRFVLAKKLGRELACYEVARCTCGEKLCVNPDHLYVVNSRSKERSASFRLAVAEWERLQRYRPNQVSWGGEDRWKADTVRLLLAAGKDYLEAGKPPVKPLQASPGKDETGSVSLNYEVRLDESLWLSIQALKLEGEKDGTLYRRVLAAGVHALEESLDAKSNWFN